MPIKAKAINTTAFFLVRFAVNFLLLEINHRNKKHDKLIQNGIIKHIVAIELSIVIHLYFTLVAVELLQPPAEKR